MKKFLALLALAFTLNGCDDGELTIEDIDFTEVEANDCGDIIYKIRGNEAFFFEVDDAGAVFLNDATASPILINVNASNRIFYRSYNADITADVLCNSIPPATPSVSEEHIFTGDNAKIEITTTPVIIGNPDMPGGQIIDRYRHRIVFLNVYENTPGGIMFRDSLLFGDYFTDANELSFNFDDQLENCGNMITNINGSEAISLDIDPELIQNAVTPAGSPRTGVLGTTVNKLLYSDFQTAVTPSYFCTTPTPSTPILKEQWTGDAGIPNVSGIIEVTTTSSGPGVFVHEIHLKKVTLRRGNSSFFLADDYLLGFLTTS